MKTYLQLCQALRREAGVQGDGPSSITSQTGIYGNIVAWIDDAWLSIQNLHTTWAFMHGRGDIDIDDDERIYTPDVSIASVNPRSFVLVDADGIKRSLPFYEWQEYQERYRTHYAGEEPVLLEDITVLDGNEDPDDVIDGNPDEPDYLVNEEAITRAVPYVITLNPDGDFELPDYPEAGYVIQYEYVAKPARFTDASSTPLLPEQYEMIIVWRALIDYGGFYNAPEAVQRGQMNYQESLTSLERNQLLKPAIRTRRFVGGGFRSHYG